MTAYTDRLQLDEGAVRHLRDFRVAYADRLSAQTDDGEPSPIDGWRRLATHPDIGLRSGVTAGLLLRAAELDFLLGEGGLACARLVRAGDHLRRAGLPYGLLLHVTGNPASAARGELRDARVAEALQTAMGAASVSVENAERRLPFARDALSNRLQLAYLTLSVAADRETSRELGDASAAVIARLQREARRADDRVALAYVRCALGMVDNAIGHTRERPGLREVVSSIQFLSLLHAARLQWWLPRIPVRGGGPDEFAVRDWQEMRHGPVLDLDTVVLAGLAIRSWGSRAKDELRQVAQEIGLGGEGPAVASELNWE